MSWLKHKYINIAEVAKDLYGDTGTTTDRSKLYNKLNGTQGRGFTKDETKKLKKLLDRFIREIKESK